MQCCRVGCRERPVHHVEHAFTEGPLNFTAFHQPGDRRAAGDPAHHHGPRGAQGSRRADRRWYSPRTCRTSSPAAHSPIIAVRDVVKNVDGWTFPDGTEGDGAPWRPGHVGLRLDDGVTAHVCPPQAPVAARHPAGGVVPDFFLTRACCPVTRRCRSWVRRTPRPRRSRPSVPTSASTTRCRCATWTGSATRSPATSVAPTGRTSRSARPSSTGCRSPPRSAILADHHRAVRRHPGRDPRRPTGPARGPTRPSPRTSFGLLVGAELHRGDPADLHLRRVAGRAARDGLGEFTDEPGAEPAVGVAAGAVAGGGRDGRLHPAAPHRHDRDAAAGLRDHGPRQGRVQRADPLPARPAAVVLLAADGRRACRSGRSSAARWSSRRSSPYRASAGCSWRRCSNRDLLLVQGVGLVIAVSFVVINFIVDILYSYLDPRISHGRSSARV